MQRAFVHNIHRGFNLIELIIVIAILVGLAGIVFVSLDPQRRLEQAREAQIEQNAEQMTQAVNLQIIDKFALPNGLTEGIPRDICKDGVPSGTGGCFSLDDLKEEGYIASIPITLEYQNDPAITGYQILREGGNVAICPRGTCTTGGGTGQQTSSSSAPLDPMSSSLYFPGRAFAVVPSSQIYGITPFIPFSISFWWKPGTPAGTGRILNYAQGAEPFNGFFIMHADSSRDLRMDFNLPVEGPSILMGKHSVRADDVFVSDDTSYHHILYTYDGDGFPNFSSSSSSDSSPSSSPDHFKLYVDGVLVPTLTTGVVGLPATPSGLSFGNFSAGYNPMGNLDDVKIFSRDLSETPADIAALADANIANDPANGLVHHWNLNENAGTTINDSVGTASGVFNVTYPPQWSTDAPF